MFKQLPFKRAFSSSSSYIDPSLLLSYCRLLGVTPHTPPPDIKAAYYRLAKLYHPDTAQSSNEEKFKAVQNAYETLLKHQEALSVMARNNINTSSSRDEAQGGDPEMEEFEREKEAWLRAQKMRE